MIMMIMMNIIIMMITPGTYGPGVIKTDVKQNTHKLALLKYRFL